MPEPIFAVVGHVNKGKSSVVAALAEDVTVAVDAMPGTTRVCRRFPMRVDGRVLYTLVDTPGFEQAAAVLDWLKQHETDSSQRPGVVQAFVDTPGHAQRFPEECELLRPILQGAAILYVVDGSRPYSPEYEAEMEILRWTGRPRMALINQIRPQDHTATWRSALDQYFSLVRTFNAHQVDFQGRLHLLQAIRELRPEDRQPLDDAIAALQAEWQRRLDSAGLRIATMLGDMLQLEVTMKLPPHAGTRVREQTRQALDTRYFDQLRQIERQTRTDIERLFGHTQLDRDEQPVSSVTDRDLFHEETWMVLGLSPRQLIATGIAAGALAGVGIDALTGGGSLGLGAAGGGVLGGISGWWSSRALPKVRLKGLPLGGLQLRIGPMSNLQFPWIALDRALLHALAVQRRTHARRDQLVIRHSDDSRRGVAQGLSASQRKQIERCFAQLRKAGSDADTGPVRLQLAERITDVLHEMDQLEPEHAA